MNKTGSSAGPTDVSRFSRRGFLRQTAFSAAAAALIPAPLVRALGNTRRKPNIVVIFSDDQGYGDLGVYGSEDLRTPDIDSITENGVRFTDGYVTGPCCVPSRVGLLTGNYHQRFGCDHAGNPPEKALMLSESLRKLGYATGIVGKWHLSGKGAGRSANITGNCYPLNQGFDNFFGFHYGGYWFLPGEHSPDTEYYKGFNGDIFRNNKAVEEKEYLTDAFGREAAAFIERRRNEPFFLYLPFNAVHLPMEATAAKLKKFQHIEDEKRRILAAMTASMDDAVGEVLGWGRPTILVSIPESPTRAVRRRRRALTSFLD